GLQTLIPVATGGRDEIEEIPLSLVSPKPFQPRRAINAAELEELANSVKVKGVLQPVLVRRLGDGGYELIAGERRWRAAKLAGLKKIPAIVRLATDAEAMEMALIENLQRKDLNPLEAARAYQRLIKEFGLTQEAVAKQLGKERRPSEIEERMTRRLCTKVRLIEGKTGGRIVIEYYSPADLERVIDLIMG